MHRLSALAAATALLLTAACSSRTVDLAAADTRAVNRAASLDADAGALTVDGRAGDGLVVLEDRDFATGTIELEIKGANAPGRSFVGLAFNVRNDSTYEAIYFRPFNFGSDDAGRRSHSVQYVSHPAHPWNVLRTESEGVYEAAFPRRPDADEYFPVRIVLTDDTAAVYDATTGAELLSVERLAEQRDDTIALWVGNNSRGAFRNLRLRK